MKKFLHFTDTHFKSWNRHKILDIFIKEIPDGIFLTGDISHSGFSLISDLEFLGKLKCPIYFVEGNHDYWFSSFEKVKIEISKMAKKHPNLIWMTKAGIVSLNQETAIIGASGFYTADIGNPNHVKYTWDWFLIKEIRKLSSWKSRFEFFKKLADNDNEIIIKNLEEALLKHNTIYLLTHYPPWIEATKINSFIDKFWLPYNINLTLGKKLDMVMQKHKDKNLIVLSGHCHVKNEIFPASNIKCKVGSFGFDFERIII